MTMRMLLLMGCAFLAACGGGGDGSPRSSAGIISEVPGVTGNVGAGLASDSSGNLFYTTSDAVFKRTPMGEVSSIAARTLVGPLGIATDEAGNVFVVERGEGRRANDVYAPSVQRIDRQGQVTHVSGNLPGGSDSIAPAIAVGRDGSYYVSAVGTLRKVTLDGTAVNVTAPEVRRDIANIAVDARGNVYFGHRNVIKKIVPGEAEVLLAEGFDFGGLNVRNPDLQSSLAVDTAGNVYVANTGDHTIKLISPAGVVTTVAGQSGDAGVETGQLPGKLNAPRGLALQGDKTLFVTSSGKLLRIDLP